MFRDDLANKHCLIAQLLKALVFGKKKKFCMKTESGDCLEKNNTETGVIKKSSLGFQNEKHFLSACQLPF